MRRDIGTGTMQDTEQDSLRRELRIPAIESGVAFRYQRILSSRIQHGCSAREEAAHVRSTSETAEHGAQLQVIRERVPTDRRTGSSTGDELHIPVRAD